MSTTSHNLFPPSHSDLVNLIIVVIIWHTSFWNMTCWSFSTCTFSNMTKNWSSTEQWQQWTARCMSCLTHRTAWWSGRALHSSLWQLVVFCTCRILPKRLKSVENLSLRFNDYLWWWPSCVVWGILFKAIKCCTAIYSASMNLACRPHCQVPWPVFVPWRMLRLLLTSKWGVVCQDSLMMPLWLMQLQYMVPVTPKVVQKYTLDDFATNTCTHGTKFRPPGLYKGGVRFGCQTLYCMG